MSHTRHEAPRELVAILWSIAGILAVFFAISISSLFVLKHYFPVDASTVEQPATTSEKCNGVEVSINNYPGEDNIAKNVPGNSEDKTSLVTNTLGGAFQCSKQCIPGITSTTIDATAKQKVAEFLNGGTIGGQPALTVTNGIEFMTKWKQWNDEKNSQTKQRLADELRRTVILSQTKASCKGPNSRDYASPIKGKDGTESNRPEENRTMEQAAEQGKTEAAARTGSGTTNPANAVAAEAALGNAPGDVNLPVGDSGGSGGSGSGSEGSGGSAGSSMDLKTCKS